MTRALRFLSHCTVNTVNIFQHSDPNYIFMEYSHETSKAENLKLKRSITYQAIGVKRYL